MAGNPAITNDRLKARAMRFTLTSTVTFFLIFYFTPLLSQVVYVTDWESEADKKVYVTEWKGEADLVVYKTDTKSEAEDHEGYWYTTEWKSEAKWKIFFTEWKSDADIVIYYTEWPSEAGWRTEKH